MADKPRKPGRPTGQKAGYDRGARPGERPRNAAGGRNAGNPERGPARSPKVGGVDLSVLDRLQQEGMLNEEGRKLRNQAGGGTGGGRTPNRGLRLERGPRNDERGFDRGPRPERGGERGFDRGPRPERGGERGFDRGPRPERSGERGFDRGPRPERGGERGFDRGPRPERAGERSFDRGPRPEREGRGPRPDFESFERKGPARGPRQPAAGFGGGGAGYSSVDEQLARTMARGPRAVTRRPRNGEDAPRQAPFRGAADAGFADRDRPDRYGREQRGQGRYEDRAPRRDDRGPARYEDRGQGRYEDRGQGRYEQRGQARYEDRAPRRTDDRGQARRPVAAPTALRGRRLNAAEVEVAERIHKVMARAGVASRRHSEELIQAGRVTVNGRVVTELGTKVVAGKDIVEVDGRPLGRPESLVYILLNKPKNVVTTLYDPEGRTKVTDLIGDEIGQRIYPVGRLDNDTEGLLVLTNDGDLANALMHPAKQVKKTYIAKVRGVPGPAKLRALEEGLELEDGLTAPADVKMLEVKAPNTATISIRIHEGRNRQVRRMFAAIGHDVIHLKRTTLGPLHLKDLPVGQWRELTEQEVRELYNSAGLRYGGKFAPKTNK